MSVCPDSLDDRFPAIMYVVPLPITKNVKGGVWSTKELEASSENAKKVESLSSDLASGYLWNMERDLMENWYWHTTLNDWVSYLQAHRLGEDAEKYVPINYGNNTVYNPKGLVNMTAGFKAEYQVDTNVDVPADWRVLSDDSKKYIEDNLIPEMYYNPLYCYRGGTGYYLRVVRRPVQQLTELYPNQWFDGTFQTNGLNLTDEVEALEKRDKFTEDMEKYLDCCNGTIDGDDKITQLNCGSALNAAKCKAGDVAKSRCTLMKRAACTFISATYSETKFGFCGDLEKTWQDPDGDLDLLEDRLVELCKNKDSTWWNICACFYPKPTLDKAGEISGGFGLYRAGLEKLKTTYKIDPEPGGLLGYVVENPACFFAPCAQSKPYKLFTDKTCGGSTVNFVSCVNNQDFTAGSALDSTITLNSNCEINFGGYNEQLGVPRPGSGEGSGSAEGSGGGGEGAEGGGGGGGGGGDDPAPGPSKDEITWIVVGSILGFVLVVLLLLRTFKKATFDKIWEKLKIWE